MDSLTDKTTVLLRTGPASPPGSGRDRSRPPPARLGRYELLHEIGRGAMGVVYRARDPVINREVALKAIPLVEEFEGATLDEARTRFFREAEMAGRLSHPHIVTIYDAGETGGVAFIAMELLRGRQLVVFTTPDRLLPPAVTLDVVAKLADALHYAHQQGVLHRDIKPANIVFEPSGGELRITDFGIARLTDANRTRTGVVIGTPSFMAPEQLQGGELSGRTDLFALGITLFQLLTGRLPFRAETIPGLMVAIAHDPHPALGALRSDLPAGLDAVLDRALAKDPGDRYASGAQMAEALRSLSRRRVA